jgi:hypothetical protein
VLKCCLLGSSAVAEALVAVGITEEGLNLAFKLGTKAKGAKH